MFLHFEILDDFIPPVTGSDKRRDKAAPEAAAICHSERLKGAKNLNRLMPAVRKEILRCAGASLRMTEGSVALSF